MTYLIVNNWERFQHYKDRNPNWIKNYVELTGSDEYRRLTLAERGLLHGIWLEYARSHRRLLGTTSELQHRLGARVYTRQLERLEQAGFIRLVAIAYKQSSAMPEKEEKEGEKDIQTLVDRTGPPLATPGAGHEPSASPSPSEEEEEEAGVDLLGETVYATLEGLRRNSDDELGGNTKSGNSEVPW
jgi:hypothetical protein